MKTTRAGDDNERERRCITIRGIEDPPTSGDPFTLLDMVSENRDDHDLCESMDSMDVDDEILAGGGGAPMFVLRRVR